MTFGPDEKLYISVGDATQNVKCSNLTSSNGTTCPAQDTNSMLGKILRINSDGTIPRDNPYPNSPVYNIGHINMYGMAFDRQGNGLVSENGDFLYDEINTLVKGGNYGAPTLQPLNTDPGYSNNSIKPLRSYYIAKCLTQLIYYDGDRVPQLKHKFLVGSLSGDITNGYIFALRADPTGNRLVTEDMISLYNFPNNEAITLAQSPSGDIYYAGYSINRLETVDMNNKIQTLFPIEINQSSAVRNISGVYFNSSANKLLIDIDKPTADEPLNQALSSSAQTHLQIKVPNDLLNGIFAVSSENNPNPQRPLPHSIENNRPLGFTLVNITLYDNTDYLISLIGESSVFGTHLLIP